MSVCYCNDCKNAFITKNESENGAVCPKCGKNLPIISENEMKSKRDAIYLSALHKKQVALYPRDLAEAKELFLSIGSYRDSSEQIESCDYLAERLIEREKKETQLIAFSPKKLKRILKIVIPTVLIAAAIVTACLMLAAPLKYARAKNFYKNGNLEKAADLFDDIPTHAQSIEYLEDIYKQLSEKQGKFVSCSTLLPYFSVNKAGAITFIRTNYSGDGNIVIPDVFDGIVVDSIGTNAFKNYSSLKSVSIPDTVLSINPYAFYGCKKLKSIELPEKVRSISPYAFKGCTSLENINVPKGVASIGEYAFSGCSSLSFPELPSGLKEIKNSVFLGCSSFEDVILPESVEKIDSHAFSGCSSITRITLSKSVTVIGKNAFKGCDSLSRVEYGGSEDEFKKISADKGNEKFTDADVSFSQ